MKNREKAPSPTGDRRLPLSLHLEELRRRLTRAALGVLVATAVSFALTPRIFHLLLRPAGDIKPVFLDLTEMIGAYFQVAMLGGLVLAIPVILYEVVMFVAPGLTPRERRYLFWLLPSAAASFLVGAMFSYFVLLPPALRFLLTFGTDIATPQIRIGNYISVVTRLMLWTGLGFETPLVLFFLAKIGLVTYRGLSRFRRFAFIGAFVMGAIITPTFDPINQSLVAMPLILLYEIGIWLARLAAPARKPQPEETG